MTSIDKEGFVEFRFFRRDARDVRIVGDFDDAGDGGFAMRAGSDGWWHAKVPLQSGEYRFRYVADGAWYTDYASNGVEVTKSGVNSVLVVPERRDRRPTQAAKLVA
jgi:1,4-alpha-glucan branching enzyme